MHIVWDWNGTLFDDLHVVVDAVNEVLGQAGVPPIDAGGYRRHYTRPVQTFYERLFGRGIAPEEWSGLDGIYHAAYRAGLEAAELTRGAREVLAALGEDRGQSLLSMWQHPELVDLVDRFGIGHHFRRIDGVRGVGGDRKHRYLEHHLEQLTLQGSRDVLVVGDTPDDADAAAAVGARCVLFDGGTHHRQDLEPLGVPIVSDLAEVLDYA